MCVIGCADCEKVYVGETNQTEKQRVRHQPNPDIFNRSCSVIAAYKLTKACADQVETFRKNRLLLESVSVFFLKLLLLLLLLLLLQKGKQRGDIVILKTIHVQPLIHSHPSSTQQRILLHETNKLFD